MLHEKHRDFLNQRGDLSATADEMGVKTERRNDAAWLCFPYWHKGELVNRKYRRTSNKEHQMDKGGRLCLWNSEALNGGPREVIITEGEFDTLAAIRCGFDRTVSVPNGAPADQSDNPMSAKRYSYLWDCHKAELEQVQTFVLAVDADKPGQILAKDLASILGRS